MEIKFKKLRPEAKEPVKIIDVDAGFDFFAISVEFTPKYVVYYTGIALEIPEGYVGLVFPRSSITDYDLMLKNCVGVIDASYRGEIMCRFHQLNKHTIVGSPNPDRKEYQIGERIAQIVFLKLPKITLKEVTELSETRRGSGAYGHTGKH